MEGLLYRGAHGDWYSVDENCRVRSEYYTAAQRASMMSSCDCRPDGIVS